MRTKTPAKKGPAPRLLPPNRRHLDWSNRETCIRCSKGDYYSDQLLLCGEEDCPIAAHSRCLHADPSFDEDGQFYCPFCWYKRQVVWVDELREESHLARRALFRFLDFKVADNGNNNNNSNEEEEEKEEEGRGEGLRKGEEVVVAEDSELSSSGDTGEFEIQMRRIGEEQGEKRKEKEKEKEDGGLYKTSSANTGAIVRFRGEKRKRLYWTAEEEDMLKEGVQKFSTSGNKKLPWRKILEFGRHVFDPTRTPSDLKDKWRNMMVK